MKPKINIWGGACNFLEEDPGGGDVLDRRALIHKVR